MEATKKLTGKSVKKWLGNNAIIVLMLLVSLFVGIIHPNFFAPANLINCSRTCPSATSSRWASPAV